MQWVIALGPLPFDVRRRNDTNCILSLWNTISGWRDGEHIHLLTWSFKRRAPILIWRNSSASFSDKNQKGEEAAAASPPRFRAGWFTDSPIPPRHGLSQEIRLKKWDDTHNCNWNNIFVLCSLSELVSIYSPRRWPELKFIHSSSSKVTFFFFPSKVSLMLIAEAFKTPINYIALFEIINYKPIRRALKETLSLTRNSFSPRFGQWTVFTTEEWFWNKLSTLHLLWLCSLTQNTSGSQRSFTGHSLQ